MKPTTLSLFAQEMHDQVSAAREAVREAERRGDPLLVQAALNHFEGLVDLARRNGLQVDTDGTVSGAGAIAAQLP